MEEKLLSISSQVNVIESLLRILLEIIRDGQHIKKFDSANLAQIILNEILKVKSDINDVELELGI